jgi:type VI protein secretion system component Hcp
MVELTNVTITSFQTGARDGAAPTETLSLNYEEIKWTYVHADRSKGKVDATWKVEEGTK